LDKTVLIVPVEVDTPVPPEATGTSVTLPTTPLPSRHRIVVGVILLMPVSVSVGAVKLLPEVITPVDTKLPPVTAPKTANEPNAGFVVTPELTNGTNAPEALLATNIMGKLALVEEDV
jgi:hypothetical protein